MKVNDFITEIGDVLQEDFTYEVLWTRNEIFKYITQTIKEFSSRTAIIDKDRILPLYSSTGEAAIPDNFGEAYYVLLDQKHKDLVQVSELDFVDSDWALNGTGPDALACTVFGSGTNARIKFVPVPTSVTGSYAAVDAVTTPILADSSSVVWTMSASTLGILSTAIAGTTGLTIILRGPSTFWDLSIDTLGVLITTQNTTATLGSVVYLTDSNYLVWSVLTTDLGNIMTTTAPFYGESIQVELDSTYQTFTAGANSANANYGAIVDIYATGVSTTPDSVARLDSPVGITILDRAAGNRAFVWYKSHIENIHTLESELFLSPGLLPIVKHGVLSMAFAHEGDGQDLEKSKILRAVFVAECDAVKQIFGRR